MYQIRLYLIREYGQNTLLTNRNYLNATLVGLLEKINAASNNNCIYIKLSRINRFNVEYILKKYAVICNK